MTAATTVENQGLTNLNFWLTQITNLQGQTGLMNFVKNYMVAMNSVTNPMSSQAKTTAEVAVVVAVKKEFSGYKPESLKAVWGGTFSGIAHENVLVEVAKLAVQLGASFRVLVDTYNSNRGRFPEIDSHLWFLVTDPKPTAYRLNAQFGCHVEEVAEMFREVTTGNEDVAAKIVQAEALLTEISEAFKSEQADLRVTDGKRFADSIFDQETTLGGVAHLAGCNYEEGCLRTAWSNFTKFVEGVPQYKEGGKVKKGPYYAAPDVADVSGPTWQAPEKPEPEPEQEQPAA